MKPEAFKAFIEANPAIAAPMERVALRLPRNRMMLPGANEAAAMVMLYPLVKFVITGIGLPWLHEAVRYADIWRLKFHKWVDEQYRQHGLDPDAADAAGIALRKELEQAVGEDVRKAWEALAETMKKENGE